MSKNVMISQSNYIPWKGYFDSINLVDVFVIYDDMQYTKRDWRNRNKIKSENGPIWLTVPVNVKGKYHQLINKTSVSDANWGIQHWKSLKQYYSKAPYFKHYKELFEHLYLNPLPNNLSQINQIFIEKINDILKISTSIKRSEEFELAEGKCERLIGICKDLDATHYYSGPSAKSYMNSNLFEEAGIHLEYFDYSNYSEYSQLYGNFVHDVTILDLIFNEGPNCTKYMKSFQHE